MRGRLLERYLAHHLLIADTRQTGAIPPPPPSPDSSIYFYWVARPQHTVPVSHHTIMHCFVSMAVGRLLHLKFVARNTIARRHRAKNQARLPRLPAYTLHPRPAVLTLVCLNRNMLFALQGYLGPFCSVCVHSVCIDAHG